MTAETPTPRGTLRWTLREVLDSHGITRYALKKASGVAMNTIRAMYDDQSKRLDFDVLERLLPALTELTGREITMADILHWENPK